MKLDKFVYSLFIETFVEIQRSDNYFWSADFIILCPLF